MEKFKQTQRTQACQAIYPSQKIKMLRARLTYFPDVETESVESRQVNKTLTSRRTYSVYIEAGGLEASINGACGSFDELSTISSTYPFFLIGDLKEFNGRDQDEDRARSWIKHDKSAFLRDQIPDEAKCLVLGILLTGQAQN